MASIKIPGPDDKAVGFFSKFAEASAEYATQLGWTPEEIEQVTQAAQAFDAAQFAAQEARWAAMGLTSAKNNQRRETTELIRQLAQRALSNPASTPTILAALGLKPDVARANPVAVPARLVAQPKVEGLCQLTWDANGNSYGTIYMIESRAAGESNFSIIGTCTKTRFIDPDAPAGETIFYRVRAQRAGKMTEASIEAGIYLNSAHGVAIAA